MNGMRHHRIPHLKESRAAIADASSQGRTLVGTDTYDSTGPKTVTIPAGAATAADEIVAIATDADGNTSEFSASQDIDAAAGLSAALSAELESVDALFAEIGDEV